MAIQKSNLLEVEESIPDVLGGEARPVNKDPDRLPTPHGRATVPSGRTKFHS